jgi:hypothetical protein
LSEDVFGAKVSVAKPRTVRGPLSIICRRPRAFFSTIPKSAVSEPGSALFPAPAVPSDSTARSREAWIGHSELSSSVRAPAAQSPTRCKGPSRRLDRRPVFRSDTASRASATRKLIDKCGAFLGQLYAGQAGDVSARHDEQRLIHNVCREVFRAFRSHAKSPLAAVRSAHFQCQHRQVVAQGAAVAPLDRGCEDTLQALIEGFMAAVS